MSRNWLVLKLQLCFAMLFIELVAANGLTPGQIYNADETRLMWKCLPNFTLTDGNEKVAHGFKLNSI